MDLNTILKAVEILGDASGPAMKLLERFIPITSGVAQDTLKERLAAARATSDQLHDQIQNELRT